MKIECGTVIVVGGADARPDRNVAGIFWYQGNRKSEHCYENKKSEHCYENKKSEHCYENRKSEHCYENKKNRILFNTVPFSNSPENLKIGQVTEIGMKVKS